MLDAFGVSKKMTPNKQAGLERAASRRFAMSGEKARNKTYAKDALWLHRNPTTNPDFLPGHTQLRRGLKLVAAKPRLAARVLP